jgi:hypothetical protein
MKCSIEAHLGECFIVVHVDLFVLERAHEARGFGVVIRIAALVEAVGIPQRTISFYEREAVAIPSTLVPALAKVLGVSMEELLGINDGTQRAKRGPKSQLERQLEAIATLPRHQQQKILAVVEAMIAHQR